MDNPLLPVRPVRIHAGVGSIREGGIRSFGAVGGDDADLLGTLFNCQLTLDDPHPHGTFSYQSLSPIRNDA